MGEYSISYKTNKSPIDYKIGDTAIFQLCVLENGEPYVCPKIKWTMSGDFGLYETGEVNDTASVKIEILLKYKGFVHLVVEACDNEGNPLENISKFDGGIGADVSEISLDTPIPQDFDLKWKEWIDELKKIPADPIYFEEVKDDSVPETHRLFDIRIPSIGDYPTSGYLSFRKGSPEGSLPIYMILTGYGVHSALKMFNENLVLHLNAHGILNGQPEEYYKKFAARFNGNYGFDNEENKNPDTCYFKNMMLRDMQGLYYLKKHPLWNGKDIILFGGSQGALQAINIAAHESDVTKCLLEIPWLCNLYGAEKGGTRGWRPDSAHGLCYFDEAVQATRVNCEVEVIAGLGDSISPPATVAAMFNSLKTTNKKITFAQNMIHQAPPENLDGYTIEMSK